MIEDRYLRILSSNKVYKNAFEKTCEKLDFQDDTLIYLNAIVPAIIGFVDWVLTKSCELGKDRLYFLSRDGYQMYLIAKELVRKKQIGIECRYLNVSRYSMRTPGYYLDMNSCLDYICVGGIDVSPYKILKRASLSDEECDLILSELNFSSEKEKILNHNQIEDFKKRLNLSETLKTCIKRYSEEAYENAIGYLTQEGLLKDNKFAIVDSGWIGTLQCSIERLLKSVKSDAKVDGFYFGVYELPKSASRQQFYPFYFSPEKNIFRKIYFSNSLFETIVSSTEGITRSYYFDNGKYLPLKSENNNPNKAQMERNIQALLVYLENLDCTGNLQDISLFKRMFSTFMSFPTKREIEAYGNNYFSDDLLDDDYKSVAAKLTKEQLKDQHFINKLLIVKNIKHATINESAWIEGSAARLFDSFDLKIELLHIRFYKLFVYARKEIKTIIRILG